MSYYNQYFKLSDLAQEVIAWNDNNDNNYYCEVLFKDETDSTFTIQLAHKNKNKKGKFKKSFLEEIKNYIDTTYDYLLFRYKFDQDNGKIIVDFNEGGEWFEALFDDSELKAIDIDSVCDPIIEHFGGRHTYCFDFLETDRTFWIGINWFSYDPTIIEDDNEDKEVPKTKYVVNKIKKILSSKFPFIRFTKFEVDNVQFDIEITIKCQEKIKLYKYFNWTILKSMKETVFFENECELNKHIKNNYPNHYKKKIWLTRER